MAAGFFATGRFAAGAGGFAGASGLTCGGIAGGMIVGLTYLELPVAVYWERTIQALSAMTFLLGIVKCAVFAILISLCGCYCGFSAEGDAQGVGRGATRAVVSSIFFVVIADAVLTLLYSFIGY